MLATGSSAFVPPIAGIDQVPYLTNETVFDHVAAIRDLIVLGGGPSHIDMWDIKPHAPLEYRGPFQPIETRINGVPRESQSHEVDHVRIFPDGSRIALEIEWNNKDPFFDRDLENFRSG